MTTTMMDTKKVLILGCGSLGSNTAMTIARSLSDEVEFDLVDHDVIENKNLANQPWLDFNVGQKKATVLKAILWHVAKSKAVAHIIKIQTKNDLRKVKKPNLIIDCFDNPEARNLSQGMAIEVFKTNILHAGFSEDGFLCSWNSDFKIKGNSSVSREPICDRRELARIVQMGSALAAEAAIQYLVNNVQRKYYFHLYKGNFFSC